MAMSSAPAFGAPPSAQSSPSQTLRSLLDARRAERRAMSLAEAVAVIVPVCLDLRERHARGEMLFVHPSSIAPGPDGIARVSGRLSAAPTHPHDRHCLPPECQRNLEPGDACASVFSLGAILYEMVTGRHIGPGMKRPREIDPTLPESVEILIGKAIIGDRAHRPSDLGALAAAMYAMAPQQSLHPPAANAAALDTSAELDVDVRFSMLPPEEIVAALPRSNPEASGVSSVGTPRVPQFGGDPFGAPIIDRTAPPSSAAARKNDPTAKLAAMKARLESDPRPRYVVSKDFMDHGPFSAVELLQQIASHAFTADHVLRDEISGQQTAIGEWEEFAPFAEQANLLLEKRAEQKAVVRAADADKKQGIAKFIIAASVVVAVGGVLAVWFFTRRGLHNDKIVVARDRIGEVEVNGDIKGKKRAVGGGGGGGGGARGYSGGQSFEAVYNGNVETVNFGGGGPESADLTNAQLSAPLRHASFIGACGAPDDMKVQVRVAVKMGHAIGVTVTTEPASGGVAACIDRNVRGLQWAVSPKTDFVTTNY